MRIAIAQLNYHIGHFEHNYQRIIDAIETAKAKHADLVVFGELALSGYPPRDFLEFDDFIDQCDQVLRKIAERSVGIGVIVGVPVKNPQIEGKDLFNAACLLADGEIKEKVYKTLLPTYDIFDEFRYFEPNKEFKTIAFQDKKIALTVCEDLWNINDNPLYTICPMDELIRQQPDVIINLSASPFDYDHAAERIRVLKANVSKYKLPVFYVNHAGAQTEIIFDGGSLVMNPAGKVFDELPYFTETVKVYDLDEVSGSGASLTQDNEQPKEKNALIHDALVTGLGNYFRKLGFSKAILGLSGGLDSAVTAVLAAKALGEQNVHAVLMPSRYSSEHSITDAKALAESLGVSHEIISIEAVYDQFLDTLDTQFKGQPFDIAEENIQARSRGLILMALANKFHYILLNTTNKSEMAVGYGTLYGDLAGGLSVIGDVYKTQVYELAQYINRSAEVIPENIIRKPPSAELRPDQKDTDSLPDYDLLDKILYQYIELRKGPNDIKEAGFDRDTVDRVLKMVNANEYKRHQTAPVLRVSSKAFGMGRRMPIVAKYLS